jgi:hypothetical protein
MPDPDPEDTSTNTGDPAGSPSAGTAGKKPVRAGATAGSSARVVGKAKTQRETDLEKRIAELEDERGTLKESVSGLEKWIQDFTKANKAAANGGKTKAAAVADDDEGWEKFANNPW